MPDLWLSLFIKFVPDMNLGFFLDTNSMTSSQGSITAAWKTAWNMAAEHAVSCLSAEFKCTVDESECLDDAKQIVS